MSVSGNPSTQYVWIWGTVPHSLSRVSYPTPLMNGGTLPANCSFSINVSRNDTEEDKSYPLHPSICLTHTRPVLADICQVGAIRSVHASSTSVVQQNTSGSAFHWGSGISVYDWPSVNRGVEFSNQKPSSRVAREQVSESVSRDGVCSTFGLFKPVARVFHRLRGLSCSSQSLFGVTDGGRVLAWSLAQEDVGELQRDLSSEEVFNPHEDGADLQALPPQVDVVQRALEAHDGSQGAVPTQPAAFSEAVVFSSVGPHHGLVTCASGRVLGWGSASHGKLGETSQRNWPFPKYQSVMLHQHVQWAVAGHSHSLFCTREGALFALGCGLHGKLGNGAVFDTSTPVQVVLPSNTKVTEATCGYAHSTCLDDEGQQYTWGSNDQGQLGVGDQTTRLIPVKVAFPEEQAYIVKVVSGPFHNVACTSVGTVYVWGSNTFHQQAIDSVYTSSPVLLSELDSLDILHIATTAKYTVCVTRNNLIPATDTSINEYHHDDYLSSFSPIQRDMSIFNLNDIKSHDTDSDSVPSTPLKNSTLSSTSTPRGSSLMVSPTNSKPTDAPRSHEKPPRPSTVYTHSTNTYGSADLETVSANCPTPQVNSSSKSLYRNVLASLTDPNDPEPFHELVSEEPELVDSITDTQLDMSSLCAYDCRQPSKAASTPTKPRTMLPIISGGSLGSHELKLVTTRYNDKLTKDAALRTQQQQQHTKHKQQELNASRLQSDQRLREQRGETVERYVISKILEPFAPYLDLTSIDDPSAPQPDVSAAAFLAQKPYKAASKGQFGFFRKSTQDRFVRFPVSNEAWVDQCGNPRLNSTVWPRICRLVVDEGIPARLRRYLWPILVTNTEHVTLEDYLALSAKATVVRRLYDERTQENPHSDIITPYIATSCAGIDVDMSRTFPHLAFYQQGSELKTNMQLVLDCFCLAYPQIGYVQGLSYQCGKLLLVLDEYHTFRCLGNITHMRFALAAYKLDTNLLDLRYKLFQRILKETTPSLHKHLEAIDILECGQSLFFLDWLLTLFSKRLDLDLSARVWDILLVFGEPTIYRVGVAIFLCLRDSLMDKTFEEVHAVLNNLKCMTSIKESVLLQHLKSVVWGQSHDAELARICAMPIHDWDNKK